MFNFSVKGVWLIMKEESWLISVYSYSLKFFKNWFFFWKEQVNEIKCKKFKSNENLKNMTLLVFHYNLGLG
jgi:hypothetical protein